MLYIYIHMYKYIYIYISINIDSLNALTANTHNMYIYMYVCVHRWTPCTTEFYIFECRQNFDGVACWHYAQFRRGRAYKTLHVWANFNFVLRSMHLKIQCVAATADILGMKFWFAIGRHGAKNCSQSHAAKFGPLSLQQRSSAEACRPISLGPHGHS